MIARAMSKIMQGIMPRGQPGSSQTIVGVRVGVAAWVNQLALRLCLKILYA